MDTDILFCLPEQGGHLLLGKPHSFPVKLHFKLSCIIFCPVYNNFRHAMTGLYEQLKKAYYRSSGLLI